MTTLVMIPGIGCGFGYRTHQPDCVAPSVARMKTFHLGSSTLFRQLRALAVELNSQLVFVSHPC